MVNAQGSITCDNFQAKERVCAALAEQVNAAQTIDEKAAKARGMMEVVEELLACEEYEKTSVACQYCRSFSLLRQKTAALILKIASPGG